MSKVYVDMNHPENGIYMTWAECEVAKAKKGTNFKGFKSMDEAREYLANPTGQVKKEAQKTIINNKKTSNEKYDAIVYADGSRQNKEECPDFGCTSYGYIIFSKGKHIIHSAKIIDEDLSKFPEFESGQSRGVFLEESYEDVLDPSLKKVDRHEYLELKVGTGPDPNARGFNATGYTTAGEFAGAARALECAKALGCKKILLGHDADEIKHAVNKVVKCYKNKAGGDLSSVMAIGASPDSMSNTSYYFRETVLDCLKSGMTIETNKIDSHDAYNPNAAGHKLGVIDKIFNDACDILAKSQLINQPMGNVAKCNKVFMEALSAGEENEFKLAKEKYLGQDTFLDGQKELALLIDKVASNYTEEIGGFLC